MDIDGWLRGIGLAEYAEMFRANDIDIELLGQLTNDDLKDIGVVSLGHRKKLLEAIAELAGAVSCRRRPRCPSRRPRTPPSVARSPSCFPILSVRPRSPVRWTPKTCAS